MGEETTQGTYLSEDIVALLEVPRNEPGAVLNERGLVPLDALDRALGRSEGESWSEQPEPAVVTRGAQWVRTLAPACVATLLSAGPADLGQRYAACCAFLGAGAWAPLFRAWQHTPDLVIGELCALLERALGEVYFGALQAEGAPWPAQAPGTRDLLLDARVRRVLGERQVRAWYPRDERKT